VSAPFDVLCWNLQFCGSRKHHFFYDGGDAVFVPRCDVLETLDGVRGVLEQTAPTLALLQEVDRGAARTHHIDQMAALRTPCWTSTWYHRSRFVPHPWPRPMGQVNLHMALLGRVGLRDARRRALPLLDESRLRKRFNLRRALLTAAVPVEGGPDLQVAVTHLSAFSYGDGTMARQVARLAEWMDSHPPDVPWILGGDLNLLPPGDDPARLGADSGAYADDHNPVEALIPRFREAFSGGESGEGLAPQNRTYQPFGAIGPDRKLDYLFVGGPITVESAEVLPTELSDHLPLVARLRL